MKAAVIREQGPVENIVYDDWPDPQIGNDEVLVRVKACALNYLGLEVCRGMLGFPIETLWISSGDVASVVEVGDRVVLDSFGREGMIGEDCQGGLAELAKVPEQQIIHIPENASFQKAAALPVGYGMAHRIVFDRAKVQEDELALILGAGGGVGLGCLQIARGIGARTICVSSRAESLEKLTAMGADYIINTSDEDFGRAAWVPALRAMTHNGRVVTCGAWAGFDPQTDIRYIWTRELNIIGANGWTDDGIAWLLEKTATGAMEPVIDSVFPLHTIQDAQKKREDRQVFGKILLEP